MKLLLITAFLFGNFAFVFGQTSQVKQENSKVQNNNVEKAKELWEKVIAAKGGRQNLYKVKTLTVSTKSYSPDDKEEFRNAKYIYLYVLPDKWRFWIDERPGFPLGIWQYDFGKEIGYEVYEGNKLDINKPNKIIAAAQGKSAKELESARLESKRFSYVKRTFSRNQLICLMETKWLQPMISGLKTENVKGKKIEVLEVLFGELKIEYYIDPQTNLPFFVKTLVRFDGKKEFSEGEEFTLEDYIEIEGVKFPQIIKSVEKENTKTTYQVNVKYESNLFNNPPSIKDGPEAWKPKL